MIGRKNLSVGKQDWCGVWLNGRHLLPSWAIDASSDVIIIDFSLQLHWSTCCTQQIMMHFSWSQHSVALRAYYFSVIKSWTSGFGILSFIIFVGHFSLQKKKKKAVFTSALTKSSDKLPRFEQQTTISQSACTDRIHTTHLDHLFWQFRNIAFFFFLNSHSTRARWTVHKWERKMFQACRCRTTLLSDLTVTSVGGAFSLLATLIL